MCSLTPQAIRSASSSPERPRRRRLGDVSRASIRPYRDGDLDDLYRICLQTGDHGEDATSLFANPRILGHVFVAPYAMFEPSLIFVAEDEAGVGGYIVGALDSRTFEKRLDASWWPALRDRYPAPPSELPPDQWTPDERAAHFMHVPLTVPADLADDYPSHLHINLVPRLQSQGLGRQLINTLISTLQDQGSVGLHFFVSSANQRAVGFYQHLGFTVRSAEGPLIFTMDLRAAADRITR
jgi:ribosomal protein S18 acetylase RimI-like enzyme